MRAPIGSAMAGESFTAEASAIVRSCVHCGFCNATCPTYQLTGDELEGPRGRIYLIKALLEHGTAGEQTRLHLDQCLLCRNCETTCPSGVAYGRLAEIARPYVNRTTAMPRSQRLLRFLLSRVLPYRRRFAALVAAGRLIRPCMPRALARLIPARPRSPAVVSRQRALPGARRVILLGGCVQPVLNPAIDAAAIRVFGHLGIDVQAVAGGGCCGALAHHLGYAGDAVQQARANIDAWWPHIEDGVAAVMATSSGCGVHLKDYARVLADDPTYAERARTLEALVRDPVELIAPDAYAGRFDAAGVGRVAVQTPCTLQHGQRLGGLIEAILGRAGFDVVPIEDAHLCCGSAGTYSLLHAQTATALRQRKLDCLLRATPAVVVTANIGCQMHLAAAAPVPVRHWLELLADCVGE